MSALVETPWPGVGECFSRHVAGHSCDQCDGRHEHYWIAWHAAPLAGSSAGSTVVGGTSGPGIPVRCAVCGGRKCDVSSCMLRRHHGGDHDHY